MPVQLPESLALCIDPARCYEYHLHLATDDGSRGLCGSKTEPVEREPAHRPKTPGSYCRRCLPLAAALG